MSTLRRRSLFWILAIVSCYTLGVAAQQDTITIIDPPNGTLAPGPQQPYGITTYGPISVLSCSFVNYSFNPYIYNTGTRDCEV